MGGPPQIGDAGPGMAGMMGQQPYNSQASQGPYNQQSSPPGMQSQYGMQGPNNGMQNQFGGMMQQQQNQQNQFGHGGMQGQPGSMHGGPFGTQGQQSMQGGIGGMQASMAACHRSLVCMVKVIHLVVAVAMACRTSSGSKIRSAVVVVLGLDPRWACLAPRWACLDPKWECLDPKWECRADEAALPEATPFQLEEVVEQASSLEVGAVASSSSSRAWQINFNSSNRSCKDCRAQGEAKADAGAAENAAATTEHEPVNGRPDAAGRHGKLVGTDAGVTRTNARLTVQQRHGKPVLLPARYETSW